MRGFVYEVVENWEGGNYVRENRLKAKLRAGGSATGISEVRIPSPEFVEITGKLGFDFVWLDAEHGPLSVETCQSMVRAAEAAGITPMIALPYSEPRLINGYLDTGAMVLLVPHLASREVAEAVVAEAKFYPLGRRGAANLSRAADYGFGLGKSEYMEWANSETMIFGILEDKDVLRNLPEILKVEEIDGFLIGWTDLSVAMGLPGQVEHPEVLKVANELIRMVLASGKILIGSIRNPDTAVEEKRRLVDSGCRMVTMNMNKIFQRGVKGLV